MFLTGEGALLAVALAALVCGLLGAWTLLRVGVRRPDDERASGQVGMAGSVRRVVVPAEAAPKA
jgi:hypothetical protein